MNQLQKELKKYVNMEKARFLPTFFKTGKGEYGEGDIFIGVVVPDIRKVAVKFEKNISMSDLQTLLDSKIHEERLLALLILVEKSKKASEKKKITEFYFKNTKNINNWDLVDLSAPKIVGAYLFDKDRSILYKFARSNHLWEKRIAIVATYYFIQRNQLKDTLNISEILLNDKHDLMHKAVGWMLREVGKKDLNAEEQFLKKYYKKMPRTMLRYAIEKFPESKRKAYLSGKI